MGNKENSFKILMCISIFREASVSYIFWNTNIKKEIILYNHVPMHSEP